MNDPLYDEIAAIHRKIVELTDRLNGVLNEYPVDVVASALMTQLICQAAGNPEFRPILAKHLEIAEEGLKAMGDLPPEEAMEAASRAQPGAIVRAPGADTADAPTTPTLQ